MRYKNPLILTGFTLFLVTLFGSTLFGKLPPLSLDGLEDEELPSASEGTADDAPKSINELCYVCHDNYRKEELIADHEPEKIGCTKCHGKSELHLDDEAHDTAPEKMYAGKGIDKMCSKCHEEHIARGTKVVERWLERCPDKKDVSKIYCTDCHYHHRLKERTVRWDKVTGKLLYKEEPKKEKEEEEEADSM